MEQIEDISFKKKNIYLMVLWSIITLGVYIGYWFLKKKNTLKIIDKAHHVPYRWWKIFTVFLSLSLLLNFIDIFIFTPYGRVVVESVDTIITHFFMGLLYYSVFRISELLEREYEELHIKRIWLVLFHIWYVQFKINELHKSTEVNYQ